MAQYQDDYERESMQPVKDAGNAAKNKVKREALNQAKKKAASKAGEKGAKTAAKAGEKGLKAGGKVAKKALKSAAKAGAKAAKAGLKKLAIVLFQAIGIPGLIIIGIILVLIISYHILFDMPGPTQDYANNSGNAYIRDENGMYITPENLISPESASVRDFYSYNAAISYYQIVGKDNEKLVTPDDESAVQDYYLSTDMFKLNSNLLFSLDKYLYENEVKYPEQFIKPVYYDPDTLTLKSLTDSYGNVVAESEEIDVKTGEKTGEQISSVKDYGLASVVKFNQTEDWQKTVKFKWTYDKKDVWDSELKKVVTQTITPESDEYVLPGYPQDIHLVEKIISFAGEIQYNYEYKESKVRNITAGTTTDKKQFVEKVLYDTYEHMVWEYELDENGEQVFSHYGIPKMVITTKETYNLYKYRTSDSGVYETVPVQTGNVANEKGMQYFYDYIENFESYIPSYAMHGFDFNERIDYDSIAFDEEGLIQEDYQVPMGGSIDKKPFENALYYKPIVDKYSDEFGINDPYILIAMIAQESAGKANIRNGLMQITSSTYPISQTAVDKNGVRQTVTVYKDDITNPEKSIRYAAAYIKRLMDKYDGDIMKAIQAYNLGEGTMNFIKTNYPKAWEDDYAWLIYREEARLNSGGEHTASADYDCMTFSVEPRSSSSKWGDACYLENVLRYYAGNSVEKIEVQGNAWSHLTASSGSYNTFNNGKPEEGETVLYYDFSEDVNPEAAEIILRTAKSFENREYFSEIENYEEMNFWDKGFMEALGSVGFEMGDIESLTGYYGGYAPPILLGQGISVSSPFGNRMHPIWKEIRFHNGIDVGAPTGTPLYAITEGTVEIAKFHKSYGNYVKLKHDNSTQSLYAHMSQVIVSEGDAVVKGQVIGYVGTTGDSTGSHLHFELHIDGNPVDPASLVQGNVAEKALEIAFAQIGKPYVWAATGPDAFDCSGLILWSYRQAGYKNISRSTKGQYKEGQEILNRGDIRRGDLIYFLNSNDGPVDHVGIYLGKENGVDKMLHAPRPGKNVEVTTVNWKNAVTIRRHR